MFMKEERLVWGKNSLPEYVLLDGEGGRTKSESSSFRFSIISFLFCSTWWCNSPFPSSRFSDFISISYPSSPSFFCTSLYSHIALIRMMTKKMLMIIVSHQARPLDRKKETVLKKWRKEDEGNGRDGKEHFTFFMCTVNKDKKFFRIGKKNHCNVCSTLNTTTCDV